MAVSITFSPTAFTRTYGGSPFSLTTNVDTESATIVSFDRLTISSASSGLTVSVSSSSISSKTITFSASSTDYDVNYSFTLGWQIKIDDSGQQSTKYGSTTFTLRINKANPTYTAPTLISSPKTVTGSAIQLIRLPGSATHGYIQYAVTTTNVAPTISGGTWYGDPTYITGTNPGTYYVWYYVAGDAGYNNIDPTGAGSVQLIKSTPPWTASISPSTVYAGQSPNIELSSLTGVSAISTPVAYIAGTTTVTNKITFGTPSMQTGRIAVYTTSSSAGSYDILVSTTGNSQYSDKSQKIQNFTVLSLPTPTYTAPTYSNSQGGTAYGFTYDGVARVIVGTAGSVASGQGTMYYKMETSYNVTPSVSDLTQWTQLPANLRVTNAGNYYGWYYIAGTYPYTNVGPSRFPNASSDGFVVAKADQTWVASVDHDEVDVGDTIILTMSNTIGYTSASVTCSSQEVTITQYPNSWHITSNTVGVYIISVSTVADSNHNAKTPQALIVEFDALVPTYSVAPEASDDITYDGNTHSYLKTLGESNDGIVYYMVTSTNVAPSPSDPGWSRVISFTTNAGSYYIWSFIEGTSPGYGNSHVIAVSGSPFVIAKATPSWTLSISPSEINPHGGATIAISGGYGTEWDTSQCVVDPTYSSYFIIVQLSNLSYRVTSQNDYGGSYTFAVRTLETANYSEKILTIVLVVRGIPTGWKQATVYVSTTDNSAPAQATAYVNTGTEQNPVWEEVQVYIYDP